jgi:hypothetical protein
MSQKTKQLTKYGKILLNSFIRLNDSEQKKCVSKYGM